MKVHDRHVAAIRALGHEGRLRVFAHLAGRGESPAGRVARRLRLPGPTLSHHLDGLARAGLVVRRRDGRFVYYRTNSRMTTDLVRLLTACC
jgi:DNA-binding transcriptional ArsR family regulator